MDEVRRLLQRARLAALSRLELNLWDERRRSVWDLAWARGEERRGRKAGRRRRMRGTCVSVRALFVFRFIRISTFMFSVIGV